MKFSLLVVLACAATLIACSQGGTTGKSTSQPANEAECRAMLEHGLDLQGVPVDAMGELVSAGVQNCVNSGKVSKEDYRCVLAATSESESRACKVDM